MLDFTGARDDWMEVASAGPYANHLRLSFQTDNRASTSSGLSTVQMESNPNPI